MSITASLRDMLLAIHRHSHLQRFQLQQQPQEARSVTMLALVLYVSILVFKRKKANKQEKVETWRVDY